MVGQKHTKNYCLFPDQLNFTFRYDWSIDKLELIWFASLIMLGGFFLYQQKLASEKKYLEAFKNNHWANLLILMTAILCYVA